MCSKKHKKAKGLTRLRNYGTQNLSICIRFSSIIVESALSFISINQLLIE